MPTTYTGSQFIRRSHVLKCDACDGPTNHVTRPDGAGAMECANAACGWTWLLHDATGEPLPTYRVLALRGGQPILRRI